MVFGPIIGFVCVPRPPINCELLLCFAVSQPVEPHVHCFGSFCLYFAVDDGVGHCIVGLDRCGGLFVAEFLEDNADVYRLSCHDVEGGEFGFCGRRHDVFYYVGDVENCSIIGGIIGIAGEEKMSACSASGFGFVEIAGVGVHCQDHVAGVICEDGFFLGGEVVEELFCLF